jgi:Zn-dependent peptidase ImmA (M78 family)
MSLEEKVAKILRRHNVLRPPVPVGDLAYAEGIDVRLAPTAMNISGALIRSSNGKVLIALNDAHHANRQRFTIAHELGHFFLEHNGLGTHIDADFTINLRNEVSAEATDSNEIHANAFAAELLMPKTFILRDICDFLPLDAAAIAKLARRYGVSEQAMTIRLVNLGFVSPF